MLKIWDRFFFSELLQELSWEEEREEAAEVREKKGKGVGEEEGEEEEGMGEAVKKPAQRSRVPVKKQFY